jgi:mannitol/fructose-specific phosphotransferase system IIA component
LSDEIRNEKPIKLTPHAKEKLKRLVQSGITEEKTIKAVQNPESVASGYFGRKIAQSSLTDELILRVVYEETDNSILVVTMYPAKRRRYE